MGKDMLRWIRLPIAIDKDFFRQLVNVSDLEDLSYDDHLYFYIFLLRAIGVGFVDYKYYGPRYLVATIFCSAVLTVFVSEIIFMRRHYSDTAKTTECLSTFFVGLVIYVKYFCFKVYRVDIRSLIEEMNNAFDEAKADGGLHWEIMSRRMKEGRLVTRFCFLCCLFVFVYYCGITLNSMKEFGMPIPAPLLGIAVDNVPTYLINLVAQCMCMIVATCSITSVSSILVYFILTICAKIEILCDMVQNIGCTEQFYPTDVHDRVNTEEWVTDHEYADLYIKNCFRVHQWIIQMSNLMNHIFKYDCLSEIFCTTIVGCVSLFQIVQGNEGSSKFYPYLIVCILQIFEYCWYGDLLMHEGLKVNNAINQSSWYQLSCSHQRMLSIMLMRAQIPIKLSAIFLDVNLQCFTTVMRSTYSYFAVISTEEQE